MNRYKSFYLLLLILCPLTGLADNYVIINQVMYDSPLNEQAQYPPYSNGEYIELYNGSNVPISLQGWEITGDGNTEHYYFPNISIASKGFLVVAFRHADSPSFDLNNIFVIPSTLATQIIYQNNVILANHGETITLYNANHEIVDQITYDGTSHLTKPDRLSADNEGVTSGNLCVSLHRTWVEFDGVGRVVVENSQWKTDAVSFCKCQLAEPSFGEHYITGHQPLSDGENFIISVSPLDPASRVSITNDGISVSNGVRTSTSVHYYDGIGRPMESINVEASPTKNDLVQVSQYTGLHNMTQKWLPVPMQTDGQYIGVSNVKAEAQSYYSDNRPFIETLYENSALGRIAGQKRQGESWASHPSANAYALNEETDNVHIYTVLANGKLKTTGHFYSPSSLYKTIVLDEDSKGVTTFTDKLGRKIMEERDGCQTYYVYDELGYIRFVLPNFSPGKLGAGEYDLWDTTLQASAFCYKYDDRGNVIYKRLPGCEPQYMVYDQSGQLILKQDGNQRLSNKWTLCGYDSIGRNLYTAEIKLTQTHEYYIDFFDDKWSVEHYGNNPSNSSIPGTGYASTLLGKNNLRPLIVNYYDDYDYIAKREPTAIRPQLRFSQESGYGLQHDNAIGLLTGTRIYNLSEEGYTAYSYYYDIKGRVIQNRSMQNVTNGYKTSTSTEYLFDGSIAQQLTEQGKGNNLVREHYRYSYDHAGRALKTYYQLNNDDEIQLSSFSYDSIGRLAQNLLHNSVDSIRYSYDMRNMLTATKNKHFSEDLFYADSVSSFAHATPCHNGNIAVARTLHVDTSFTFIYSYDQLNRLVESEQDAGDHTKPSEWFRYDDRGNIRQLQRYSGDRLIDDLHFSYQEDGNQLLSITDDGEDADLYSTIEYHNAAVQADTTMYYDANGNLIKDKDRGIVAIHYNILNLPDTIQFVNGNQIVNLYDAAGKKYKSIIYSNLATVITPCYEMAHYTFETDSIEYHVTEYNGNVETYYTPRDTALRIFNAIGYYTDSTYYHYIKDHLGNVCAVIHSAADSVVQSTKYYASGVPMAESVGRDEQPYLYNGKEFVEAHGLNEYDSQARMYYATIMRTTTIDPYAEKYYHISPYAWCGNNSIAKVDENGQYYFDWDDWCYRSSYGNHNEVSWNEVLWNEFIEPRPIDQIGPLRMVGEFGLGNGAQERNFGSDDNFTQQFTTDNERLEGIYNSVAEAIFNRGFENSAEDENGTKDGKYNYSLGSKGMLEKIGIMTHDAANAAGRVFNKVSPFGLTVSIGNLAASVVGSFSVTWELERYDSNGDAVVTFRLENSMSAASATRPPFVGYTDFWKGNVGSVINKAANSRWNFTGFMRTVKINMTWTTTIKNPNKR
jgi:RHS repeat-associated protein